VEGVDQFQTGGWITFRAAGSDAECVRAPKSIHCPRLSRKVDEVGGCRTLGNTGLVGADGTFRWRV